MQLQGLLFVSQLQDFITFSFLHIFHLNSAENWWNIFKTYECLFRYFSAIMWTIIWWTTGNLPTIDEWNHEGLNNLFSDCFHYSCVLRTCSFYLFILYTIPSSFQLLSHCALGIFYMLTNLTSKVISFEEFAVYLLIRSLCESNPESNFYFIIFFLMKTSWPLQFHHLLHPQLLWGVFKSPSVLQEQSAVQVFISFTCFYVNK